jgi:hypothetical protein
MFDRDYHKSGIAGVKLNVQKIMLALGHN